MLLVTRCLLRVTCYLLLGASQLLLCILRPAWPELGSPKLAVRVRPPLRLLLLAWA